MSTLHGFELIHEQAVPELNTKARLFRHVRTGAELLSMENADTNKVFSINFYTPPATANGVAHIMEHSVLCGSRKYPLKEPFVELIKGSLNTFVNAFTFSDKTCYPVASQVLQDFYNLIDVYMDAVFYPTIAPQTLQQEGWHYELMSEDAPLIYKGVVFNEMKGSYSSPDRLLGNYSQATLFPDTAYGVDSGGDPKVIPDLTYEQFKAFHDTYYHPSNALIYFYGDDDPTMRLQIADGYLKDFEARPIDKTVRHQPRFTEPRRFTYPYDMGAEETDESDEAANKAMVTVNWVLADTTDTETHLGLQILAYLLTGTPAAPLYKALIDSGFGESLAGGGLDDQIAQMIFSTGLKGIAAEAADGVEALIFDTLRGLVQGGIEADIIEAALNTVEFRLRENNTGQFPRGLALMLNALTTWLYGGDPLAPVAFEAPLAAIKAKAADHYFERLITQYLLDNPHRTTVILTPDPTVREREEVAETERLARARSNMTADKLRAVMANTEALRHAQETPDSPEALALIPTLKLSDLDKHNPTIPLAQITDGASRIIYHDLFTNGIAYFDVGFDLHMLPDADLPYVELFSRALLEMGTATEDYVKLTQRIGRKTGGLDTATFFATNRKAGEATTWLFLQGKSTVAQVDDLLAILRDVLETVNFDNQERFKQIAVEEKADLEAGIVPSGHIAALTRLRAHFSEAEWATEQTSGVSYLFFLRDLIDQIDRDWSSVRAKLETMRRTLLNRRTMLTNVTLDAANWAIVAPKLTAFLAALPESESTRVAWNPKYPMGNEGLTIPTQVNYVAKGANLYAHGYQVHGSHMVILNYLRTTWLWERVRVQGGAYGGFAVFSRTSGTFGFVSYRDPNLLNTLDIYDATGGFLRELKLDDAELTRAIIGTIGDIDGYLLPDAKGYTSLTSYLVGDADADRQRLRDEVLGTTAADFHAFADVIAQVAVHGAVTVVGSAEDIAAANRERESLLTVVKVV